MRSEVQYYFRDKNASRHMQLRMFEESKQLITQSLKIIKYNREYSLRDNGKKKRKKTRSLFL